MNRQRWQTDFLRRNIRPKKYQISCRIWIPNDVAFTIGLNIVGATNRISTSDNLPLLPTQNETKINVPKSDGDQENEVDPTTPNKQRNHGDQSYEENARTYARTHAHARTHARTHAHTHTHTHTHTHNTHTHTRARAHAHARTHAHTCMHTHAHTCMHTHAHTCMHTHAHTCMHTHAHTCMHTHACTHTHTHTHKYGNYFIFTGVNSALLNILWHEPTPTLKPIYSHCPV